MKWELPANSDGVHVQICRDHGCANEVTSFDAAGTSGAVAEDLPVGILFWRAYGRSAGVTGGVPTPTWQFAVGALSAPINTSWGTTLDVDNDGFADIVVGAPSAGAAYLYPGSSAGPAPSPTVKLTGPGTFFGSPVSSAGDVDGDGYPEVMVASVGSPTTPGYVYVYKGSASGLISSPAYTLTGPDGVFGHSIASAGDVNGDGYGDVLVGAPQSDGLVGRINLYLGSASGLAEAPALTLSGPDGANGRFGHALAGAGDVNGDGYADIVVAADGIDSFTGRVYLFLGGPSGLGTSPASTLNGPDGVNGYFGLALTTAGDVNGDGYADVLVGANGVSSYAGRAYSYLGGPTGLSPSPAVTLIGADVAVSGFGVSCAAAGDVNGDGYADVIVGEYGASGNGNLGNAYLFLGGAAGLAASPDVTLTGLMLGARFGRAVAGAGDVDGDGYSDVLVGADFETGSATGWAYLYSGSATGIGPSPAFTLNGVDPGGQFGHSVAMRVESTSGVPAISSSPAGNLVPCRTCAPLRRSRPRWRWPRCS